MNWTISDVADRIQHTLVSPDATEADIRRICQECVDHQFDGAMIQPCWVPLAKSILKGTTIKVCTAFGYPMGGDGVFAKAAAARDCVARGADEMDFMPNMGLLKSGYDTEVLNELKMVVQAAEGRVVKAMLELGMLTEDEGKRITELCIEAGVHYVKNSSGFGKGGKASVDILGKLKSWAGDRAKVKASGGVKTFEQAVALFDAGVDLIGTSSGVSIVQGTEGQGEY